jgi:hypothetical protein
MIDIILLLFLFISILIFYKIYKVLIRVTPFRFIDLDKMRPKHPDLFNSDIKEKTHEKN